MKYPFVLPSAMERMSVRGKDVCVFPPERNDSPLVVVNIVQGEGAEIYEAVRRMTDADMTMVAIGGIAWDEEMSPWPAPSPFSGDDYTGHADRYLADLTGTIIPSVEDKLSLDPSYRVLAGYSLAGLFTIYSLFRTDMFKRAVCASGSMWYPGILEFVSGNDLKSRPDRLYMSLGDRESRTRNPVMATVGERTDAVSKVLSSRVSEFRFEINPGNHFADPAGRMAKGIAWVLG